MARVVDFESPVFEPATDAAPTKRVVDFEAPIMEPAGEEVSPAPPSLPPPPPTPSLASRLVSSLPTGDVVSSEVPAPYPWTPSVPEPIPPISEDWIREHLPSTGRDIPYLPGRADVATAVANVPISAVNIGAFIASQPIRMGEAAYRLGKTWLGEMVDPMGEDPEIQAMIEQEGQRSIILGKQLADEMAEVAGQMVGVPLSVTSPITQKIAPAIHEFQEKHGVTLTQVMDRFQTDPVGTTMMVLPALGAYRSLRRRMGVERPITTEVSDITPEQRALAARAETRERVTATEEVAERPTAEPAEAVAPPPQPAEVAPSARVERTRAREVPEGPGSDFIKRGRELEDWAFEEFRRRHPDQMQSIREVQKLLESEQGHDLMREAVRRDPELGDRARQGRRLAEYGEEMNRSAEPAKPAAEPRQVHEMTAEEILAQTPEIDLPPVEGARPARQPEPAARPAPRPVEPGKPARPQKPSPEPGADVASRIAELETEVAKRHGFDNLRQMQQAASGRLNDAQYINALETFLGKGKPKPAPAAEPPPAKPVAPKPAAPEAPGRVTSVRQNPKILVEAMKEYVEMHTGRLGLDLSDWANSVAEAWGIVKKGRKQGKGGRKAYIPGVRKGEKGLTQHDWAEYLKQNYPEEFKSRTEALEWLDDDFLNKAKKGEKPLTIEESARQQEQAFMDRAQGRHGRQAERFGIEERDVEPIVRGEQEAVSIAEGDLKPGDVVYLPDHADTFRVKKNPNPKIGESDVMLKDGGPPIKLGYDETVQGVRMGEMAKPERAVRPTAEPAAERPSMYFKGDRAEYTGKKEMLHGKMAYELELMEGHRKGEMIWQYEPPKGKAPTMAEAARAIEDAKAERTGREKAEAVAEETGQAGMFDDTTATAKAGAKDRATKAAGKQREAEAPTLPGLEPQGGKLSLKKEQAYRKALADFKKKTSRLSAGIDPTAVKELVTIAAYHAEVLARASGRGVADFAQWTTRVTKDLVDLLGEKYKLSKSQLHKLWNEKTVRLARERPSEPAQPAPKAQGMEARWIRQAARRGMQAYHEYRRAQERVRHGITLIERDMRARYKGLKRDAQDALAGTLRGINHKGEYGSVQRAGTIKFEKGAELLEGTRLDDGRYVGPQIPGRKRTHQLYRLIWPDEAKAMHDALKKNHPEASKLLEAILAEEEAPVVTIGGDRLPGISRRRLKEDWGVEGLTAEEAHHASALIRETVGPEGRARGVPTEWSWIPESAEGGGGILRRARNAMRPMRAGTRKYKSGEAFERAMKEGREIDLKKGLTKTRIDLYTEQIHNDMLARILSIVAEPIVPGQGIKAGYKPFTKSGFGWGESNRWIRFLDRNRAWFEEQGISVADAIDATYTGRGKAYQVPGKIANDLGAFFRERVTDVDPRYQMAADKLSKAVGDTVSAITVSWLVRPSTAVRNALGQGALYNMKIVRDFFEGVYNVGGVFRGEQPFQPLVSDFYALGKALTKESRQRLPAEYLGQTFLGMMEEAGPIARGLGHTLRATSFNFWDIYAKRAVKEAVYDANARRAWRIAKEAGEIKPGTEKAKWIREWKDAVPKDIEQLAYREMDAFAFDYQNTAWLIESAKKNPIARGFVPYPTFFYKLANHVNEMVGPHNFKTMLSKTATRKQKVRALANVSAFVTVNAVLWNMLDDNLEFGGDMTDDEIGKLVTRAEEITGRKIKEEDLPYAVQRFGRLKIPGTERWVRIYDIPYLGDVMAAKAIFGKNYSFQDYIHDRIALGPMQGILALWEGLSNKYNQHLPPASRAGRAIASFTPFSPFFQSARRLIDPWKRKGYRKSDPGFLGSKNFVRGFMENYPGLSNLLDERVNHGDLSLGRYNRWESLASLMLLNTKEADETERRAAIASANIALQQDLLDETKEDLLREQIKRVMDAQGKTRAGDVKKSAKQHEFELGLKSRRLQLQTEMYRLWNQEGEEAAVKKAKELIGEAPNRKMRESLIRSYKSLLRLLRMKRDKGLTAYELERAPTRIRQELKEGHK